VYEQIRFREGAGLRTSKDIDTAGDFGPGLLSRLSSFMQVVTERLPLSTTIEEEARVDMNRQALLKPRSLLKNRTL
jgi:hypothetical protein